jgi:lipopolysaccharide export system protein LptA
VTVESDLQQADNTTGIVTATGNVRIVYPDQRVVATARQAQYYSKEGRLVLSGDVDVIQADGHSVKAERVLYDVNRERISAEPPPGGQVFSRYRMNSPGQPVPTPGQHVPVPGQAARTPGTGGVAQ